MNSPEQLYPVQLLVFLSSDQTDFPSSVTQMMITRMTIFSTYVVPQM